MRDQLEGIDERAPGIHATFDAEHDHGASFAAQVFLTAGEFFAVGEPREADPTDARLLLQPAGHGQGVFTVAFHA